MKKPGHIVKDVVGQLKALRKAQALSHEKVAARALLNRSTISVIETGKRQPTLLTLLKIAQALESDLGSLIAKAERPD